MTPDHVRYWEPWPRRMRAILGGVTVLDSRRGVVLHETGHLPEHYYPVDDLDPDLLSPAEPTEAGAARWDIGVAGRVAATAVTAYTDPSGADGGPPLADFVAVDFAAMDRWFEEDDPVYGHLRDPYHRVDVRAVRDRKPDSLLPALRRHRSGPTRTQRHSV